MNRIRLNVASIAALCLAGFTGTARAQDDAGALMNVSDRTGGDNSTIHISLHDIGSIRFDPCVEMIVRYNDGSEGHIDLGSYGTLTFIPCDKSKGPGGKAKPVAIPGAVIPSGLTVEIHPNPTSSSLAIEITSDRDDHASVGIYDLAGNQIWTRNLAEISPGTTQIVWEGTDSAGRRVSSGTYVVRVTTPDRESTRNVTVTK
ncbi:MAG: FlgD immunoglobulin-like domain containing protein [Bacteroidota bacterium]